MQTLSTSCKPGKFWGVLILLFREEKIYSYMNFMLWPTRISCILVRNNKSDTYYMCYVFMIVSANACQNLLVSTNEVTPVLKIGDFGFAR